MATAQQVINLNTKHPDWTAEMIAVRLGCLSSYVRATGQRKDLTFAPKVTHRPWMDLPNAQERYDALVASMTPRQRVDMRGFAKARIGDADLDWASLIE
jgi:hypothetical protein